MDEDLQQLNKDQLIEEVKKLRAGIREHRDSTGQDLCWHHSKLWSLLPEKIDPKISVPEWPEFLKGCIRYRQSLDKQIHDFISHFESKKNFRDISSHSNCYWKVHFYGLSQLAIPICGCSNNLMGELYYLSQKQTTRNY